MFDGLIAEMARIKSRKFHLVDGPAPPELVQAVREAAIPIPPSYKEFVLRFGNAQLYRKGSGYQVQVFAAPREALSNEGESLLNFGRADSSLAYFKEAMLVPDGESPVFHWYPSQGLRKAADGFEPWLEAQCKSARKTFKRAEWKAIEEGPPPFTEQERAIVEARELFRWSVVGVADGGGLLFEVYNGSTMTLPYLSIGIRGELRPPKVGPLHGGVWLPVASIAPGETRMVEKDCYKDLIDGDSVEAFALPAPEPEDRDRYWEFKS